jgi:arsenite/tail-anchored protein-transporting ATPase
VADRGHPVADLTLVLDGALAVLMVHRIDPAAETARYVAKIMATRGRELT